MAIVEDGDLATEITPNIEATPIFAEIGRNFINGIISDKKYMESVTPK